MSIVLINTYFPPQSVAESKSSNVHELDACYKERLAPFIVKTVRSLRSQINLALPGSSLLQEDSQALH